MELPLARGARVLATVIFSTAAAACTTTRPCADVCIESATAVIQLSCDPTDLTSATVTGPCARDAGVQSLRIFPGGSLYVGSPTGGVCHVSLAFASGFTYETDVTFAMQTDNQPGCGNCPPYVGPTQSSFSVGNPSNTCKDAGLDGGPDA
jgi:hypothetical protein